MTPPFQSGDRVTVRYNKPLGVLVVKYVGPIDNTEPVEWVCQATGLGSFWAGPATSLIKVEDEARREA